MSESTPVSPDIASRPTSNDGMLFCYDCSGSTSNNAFYHQTAQRLLDTYAGAKIVVWNTQCHDVTAAKMKELNGRMSGDGGTDPACIARYIESHNFHGYLILMTDGQVDDSNIARAELHRGWSFTQVDCYLIYTGNTVNMSVTCPFTRSSAHTVHHYSPDPAAAGSMTLSIHAVTAADLATVELLDSVKTVEAYLKIADALERALVARCMGTMGDPTIHDALLAMKRRIVRSEAKSLGKSNTLSLLEKALVEGDTARALCAARTLTNEYYGIEDAKDDRTWSGRISRLVSMCQGALKRGAFDAQAVNNAIRSDRVRRAEAAADATPQDLSATTAAAAPPTHESTPGFTCPVTLENESDVILLIAAATEVPSVLAGLDDKIANDVIDCPLNALNHPEVVERIKAHLDHPISLKAFQAAYRAGSPITVSPMTRRVVDGGLCLGAARDHCDATMSVLARMIAGGRVVGNMSLWFAVIWLMVKRGDVPYLEPLLSALEAHMKFRLATTKTSLGMTGLPQLPTTRAPLRVAVWYVLAASALELPPRWEPLRAHLGHAAALQELVALAGFALPNGVPEHCVRLRLMQDMLSTAKRDFSRFTCLLYAIRSKTLTIDLGNVRSTVLERLEIVTPYIPIDGPALTPDEVVAKITTIVPVEWRQQLSFRELLFLMSKIKARRASGTMDLPFELTDKQFASVVRPVLTVAEWPYGLGETVAPLSVEICPATCRPVYRVSDHACWGDAARELYGRSIKTLLSGNELFGRFVDKFEFYPTLDELLLFAYNRVVASEAQRHSCLPACAVQLFNEVLSDFEPVVAVVNPSIFVSLREKSRSIPARVKMEQELLSIQSIHPGGENNDANPHGNDVVATTELQP